ncbi:MAG: methylated-DNA--[protein]-cysteine S-methyltransferase [Nitrospiraceae bacterium]
MKKSLTFKTPWGWMGIAASGKGARAGVCRIVLPHVSRRAVEATLHRESLGVRRKGKTSRLTPGTRCILRSNGCPSRLTVLVKEARAQLVGFLEGKRRELDFPIDLSGGSVFQRRVWRAILRIPYGRVRSYKWVALRVGGTRYARAVGHALGDNPVPIVIPCHRVVAHDASLGGFTGGLRTKRRLLQLEGTLQQLSRKI